MQFKQQISVEHCWFFLGWSKNIILEIIFITLQIQLVSQKLY